LEAIAGDRVAIPRQQPRVLGGYTALALSSEDGDRQVVICSNDAGPTTDQGIADAYFDAVGKLAWRLYCM